MPFGVVGAESKSTEELLEKGNASPDRKQT